MAKRFTDSNKYKKLFIRKLPAAYKILWDYLYHDCDHAGIWHVDFDIAQVYIGKDAPVNEEEALTVFNLDEQRILVLNNGSKWLILPFIAFQYGVLNSNVKLHISVINLLEKEGVNEELVNSLGTVKDKNKDKVIKQQNTEENKSNRIKNTILIKISNKEREERFESLWNKYKKKDGRKQAFACFCTSVKTVKNWEDIQTALINYNNYVEAKGFEEKYIKNGSTWFNNWADWVKLNTKSDIDKRIFREKA